MAAGVTIQISGVDKIKQKLGSIPKKVIQEIDGEMSATANEFVNRAIQDAPVDQSILRQEISFERISEMNYVIVSRAEYSAYIEFGTRGRVQVPAEVAEYASQFQGAQSSGDAKKMIYDWCKRVGVEPKFWFPVFISIMTKGIYPHPFFFKQLPIAREEINRNLKGIIQRVISQ